MKNIDPRGRREFLKQTGLAGGALVLGSPGVVGQAKRPVSIVIDPADPVGSAQPALWAASELEQALKAAGTAVRRRDKVDPAADELCIVAKGLTPPSVREGLAIGPAKLAGRDVLIASGSDTRGVTYALLELADRVRHGTKIETPIAEQPANEIRSIMRQFTSEPLDKPWFYDREMWPKYLTMLATQRFNRFHLSFGLGYDFLRQVDDPYLLFIYPFLMDVPGYKVRATNLSDAERDKNLETLRFITEQTVARGIEFQLGVWMHGYEWINTPNPKYKIEGLTHETHAAYSRDALTALLRACPAISSVTLRIHGESGVQEGSYEFWKTIFDGVKNCGRKVEMDLHAKGIDAKMIDNAIATGMPVNVAPKYWAEHLGMPYHQAAIRDLEMPVEGKKGAGLMTLSEGSRVFTRYGYGDLIRADRKYTIRHRIFAGTQRILMSGDPEWMATYSKMFQFCGSNGVDVMEPLTARGRRGTGIPGTSRIGYVDAKLEPRWDWEKYQYWYRVWGRLLYNPQTPAEVWRRSMQNAPLESSLASVSRILPIVTTAHLPSAACDAYWPEVYWNQAMAIEPQGNPYTDTPVPKLFQYASTLDPQLFSRMTDFADELLKGERTGKYSPIEVAVWLEELAGRGERDLGRAGQLKSGDARRIGIDIEMEAALGRFFAAKFRSGVLYSIFERSGDRKALDEAIKAYRRARGHYAQVADRAKGVYATDLSASDKISNRGSWADRLPLIDDDIARLEKKLGEAKLSSDTRVNAAIQEALGSPRRVVPKCNHQPPTSFRPGDAVALEIAPGRNVQRGVLYYRHVNQAERFQTAEMKAGDNVYRASIPADYTASPYELQYYFEFRESPERAWIYPGFPPNLAGLPYFVLQRS